MTNALLNIGYFCENTQQAINAGINGFAVTLLAESYGDKIERYPKGGIAFAAEDHKRRPVYVTISAEPPAGMEGQVLTTGAEHAALVRAAQLSNARERDRVALAEECARLRQQVAFLQGRDPASTAKLMKQCGVNPLAALRDAKLFEPDGESPAFDPKAEAEKAVATPALCEQPNNNRYITGEDL